MEWSAAADWAPVAPASGPGARRVAAEQAAGWGAADWGRSPARCRRRRQAVIVRELELEVRPDEVGIAQDVHVVHAGLLAIEIEHLRVETPVAEQFVADAPHGVAALDGVPAVAVFVDPHAVRRAPG